MENSSNIYFDSNNVNDLYDNFYLTILEAMKLSKVIVKKRYDPIIINRGILKIANYLNKN